MDDFLETFSEYLHCMIDEGISILRDFQQKMEDALNSDDSI